MLLDEDQNPVRNQIWEAQIEYHKLPVKRRQLQSKIKEHAPGAQRFKQAYIGKELSNKNLGLRQEYGETHKNKTIESFWQ